MPGDNSRPGELFFAGPTRYPELLPATGLLSRIVLQDLLDLRQHIRR
jgi:hypothetical protein